MSHFFLILQIKLLAKFFPKSAYRCLKTKLLAPKTSDTKWPKGVKRIVFTTRYGKVRTYQHGKGKCIWLIHGWSDAYQFWPLMQKLAKQGYCCIAMEMLPDNKAHNRLFSLANWTNVFDVAARSVPEPNHVLAHGLGASIIGNSQWLTEYDEDLTLVSPALDLSTSLDMFFNRYGLPNSMLKKLKSETYINDNVSIKGLNATPGIEKFDGRLTVFYSRQDETSTVKAIKRLSDKSNRKIVQFKGAKTMRIMNSRSLVSVIKQQAKKLDMSI